MKTIIIATISGCLILCSVLTGCRTSYTPQKVETDPFTFEWVRSANVLSLKTCHIYYQGIVTGGYSEEGDWIGKIKGQIIWVSLPENGFESIRTKDGVLEYNEKDERVKITNGSLSTNNAEMFGENITISKQPANQQNLDANK